MELEVRDPELTSIFEVYNHLKAQRDIAREILRVNEEGGEPSILPALVLGTINAEERFLTRTLAMIDRGLDRPTEDDR
jgi:hypothetical protein